MKHFKKSIYNDLFYNLILFDFILLSSSNKKISSFFVEKYIFSKKNYLVRLVLFDLLKSFKRFIRIFQFIQKFSKQQQLKSLLYIWLKESQNVIVLNMLFRKYKLPITLKVETFFPHKKNDFLDFNNILIFDQKMSNNKYKNLFFKDYYLIQQINVFEEKSNWGSYKIFNSLTDFKKLIFIGLLLIQIFKK
jgi:hypothetical protein